jgi:hypothetical protein
VLFVLAGVGLVWYFEAEKKRMQRRRVAEATKGVGKPKVGGDFNLVDHEGRPFSSADLKGRYSLVSSFSRFSGFELSFPLAGKVEIVVLKQREGDVVFESGRG